MIERFGGAGIAREKISFQRDTFTFRSSGAPAQLLATFRQYYGPTMNAFVAAQKSGRADDLQRELQTLFEAQNKSARQDETSIPATFLRVTVAL